MQILRNTPATLELNVYQAGDLTDLDAVPTVTITDANGVAVDSGNATKPGGTTGTYRFTMDAQANVKALKAVWSGDLSGNATSFTQHHEVVGNLLFTEADARGARFTGQQAPLSSESTFTDSAIAAMRTLVTNQFEEKTGRSWIRRYARIEVAGTGTHTLSLWRSSPRDVDGNTSGGSGRERKIAKILSATANGTAVDTDILVLKGNRLWRTSGTWPAATQSSPLNVVIEYEYGDDPVDLEARENGLRMVVANLVPSDVPDYAQTLSVGGESYSFQQADALRGMLRVYPEKVREWLDRNRPMAVA